MNTFDITFNFEAASATEAETMELRRAARCVIYDTDGNVALVHFSVHNFYKVPGGGVEDGESVLVALKRECLEEAGVYIENITYIGTVTEIKKEQHKKQISQCYRATVAGEKMETVMTEDEHKAGAVVEWMPLSEAVMKLESTGIRNLSGKYVHHRELTILNACL
ncbi:NUDIX hydrolase [Patescibacteria group bacterium]|nr:NUDIX hydrolase [Patescibacteria group bacterium]